jgi:hypothetical protein
MIAFADKVVKPFILESGYRRICEIGSNRGENADKLLELPSIELTLVDPCTNLDLSIKYKDTKNVRVERGLSLEVLPRLSQRFDCILLDGDHNWYTVYHELKIIDERGVLEEGGTIFLHDVGWPYGRRDMYYQPELIPAEFRQPHERKGLVYGDANLSDTSKFNADLYNAVREGGPRNGVLTAVEDFVNGNVQRYEFFRFREEVGLGVLHKIDSHRGNKVFRKYQNKARVGAISTEIKNRIKRMMPQTFIWLRTGFRDRHRRN